LRKDGRGIEGLPLRLMLVALLISLTLPAVLASLADLSATSNDRMMARVAEDLARTVEEMASAGPGNVRTFPVPPDLPAGAQIRIGGSDGSAESARVSWCSGGTVLGSRYLNGAAVLTDDGSTLSLGPGDALRLTCPTGVWGEVRAELA
jgi:hypothetical protein